MMKKDKKKGSYRLVYLIFVITFILSGCDKISGLFNPFVGTWKSGPLTLTFDPDKSFELETGLGVILESQGTYRYDDDYLYLNFSDDYTNEFTFEFNDEKSVLSLSPKTKSRWFKATISFDKDKQNNN